MIPNSYEPMPIETFHEVTHFAGMSSYMESLREDGEKLLPKVDCKGYFNPEGAKNLSTEQGRCEYMTAAINTAHVEVVSSPIPLLFLVGAVLAVLFTRFTHNFFVKRRNGQIPI